jgi:hypothetical protein
VNDPNTDFNVLLRHKRDDHDPVISGALDPVSPTERGPRTVVKISAVNAVDPAVGGTPLSLEAMTRCTGFCRIDESVFWVTGLLGPTIWLTTALTDAPPGVGVPMGESHSDSHTVCETTRSERGSRKDSARRRAAGAYAACAGVDETICEICIAVNPWTARYLPRRAPP